MAVIPTVPSAASTLTDGPLEHFLGPPALSQTRLFSSQRFPNVVVTKSGAVLAVWGQTTVQSRRSADGGVSWGSAVTIRTGIHGGGVTVDESSGDILTFVEEEHPPATLHVLRSQDDGLSWSPQSFTILPNSQGHVPSMHMNEHGTTLRHGTHAGRLIRPSRWYGASNYPAGEWPTHYTNAMFSDDGGQTWQASEAFPVMGTGEACIVELSDGRLHYNTRRHWAETGADALWRWSATSSDGGLTWTNPQKSTVLPDGNTNSTYGLMGGMVRLPVAGRDILLFSNVVNNSTRANGNVWVSFDGGLTWPLRRSVFSGSFAYSAMAAGRPGTPSQGWIYLFYEGGPEGGGTMARFNLAWLLQSADLTGNGGIPEWIDYEPVTPPPAENPGAAFWAFEETPAGQTISTAQDAIIDVHPDGNNLHLTATAAFPVIAGAPAFGNGRAIAITGNGGARILDDASQNRFDFGPSHSFTIEVVCRIPSGSTQVGALVAKDLGPTSPSWWLRVDGGKARFLVSDNATERVLSSAANINTGNWHHIAAVRDATDPANKQLRLFIDGQPSGTLADTTTGTLANGNAVWIGRFNSGSRLLTGDIDLVRITPAALTPAEFVSANPPPPPRDLIWRGQASGAWDTGTTANWQTPGGSATTFLAADEVRFDGSAATTVLTIPAPVAPGAVEFDFDAPATYQLGGPGGITGTAPIVKSGTGLLEIAAANDSSGALLVESGAVRLLDGATWGTGGITNHGVFEVNRTSELSLTNAFSGTGSLVKQGSGTLVLAGGNGQYNSGDVTVNDGTLQVGTSYSTIVVFDQATPRTVTVNHGATLEFVYRNAFSGVGSTVTSALVIDGGTVTSGGSGAVNSFNSLTLGNGATLHAETGFGGNWGTYQLQQSVIVVGTSASAITASSDASAWITVGNGTDNTGITTFEVADATNDAAPDLTIQSRIRNSRQLNRIGGLTKTGAGNLLLTADNSYTGATTVSEGTLTVTGSLANTAVTVASNSTLAGNGPLGGAVTIQSGGIHALAVADTPANQMTRTITGTLTLDAGNVLTLTAATPPANGTYILATANGGITGTPGTVNLPAGISEPTSVTIDGNKLVLNVVAASDYDDWAGPSGFNLTGGPDEDDDGDGLSNFAEYAFGLNPTSASSVSPLTAPDKTAGTFTYTRRKPSLTGLAYTCQSSTTLMGWTDFTPASESSNNGDPVETITVTLPAALLAEDRLFLRVKAHAP